MSSTNKIKVAITGNIGSGKSTFTNDGSISDLKQKAILLINLLKLTVK